MQMASYIPFICVMVFSHIFVVVGATVLYLYSIAKGSHSKQVLPSHFFSNSLSYIVAFIQTVTYPIIVHAPFNISVVTIYSFLSLLLLFKFSLCEKETCLHMNVQIFQKRIGTEWVCCMNEIPAQTIQSISHS